MGTLGRSFVVPARRIDAVRISPFLPFSVAVPKVTVWMKTKFDYISLLQLVATRRCPPLAANPGAWDDRVPSLQRCTASFRLLLRVLFLEGFPPLWSLGTLLDHRETGSTLDLG